VKWPRRDGPRTDHQSARGMSSEGRLRAKAEHQIASPKSL
jgi:hypothetical protein